MSDQVCSVCRHALEKHTPPVDGRPYWTCTQWIGHPWDGPCECRERFLTGVRA